MKHIRTFSLLLALISSLLFSSCLTQRTVTQGGRTVKQDYVIKRPLKDALDNSAERQIGVCDLIESVQSGGAHE